jgi:hypothetical protein
MVAVCDALLPVHLLLVPVSGMCAVFKWMIAVLQQIETPTIFQQTRHRCLHSVATPATRRGNLTYEQQVELVRGAIANEKKGADYAWR